MCGRMVLSVPKGTEMAYDIVQKNHSDMVRVSHPLTNMFSGFRNPWIMSLSVRGRTQCQWKQDVSKAEWQVSGADISPEGFGRNWDCWRPMRPCSHWGSCSAPSRPGICDPAPLPADWGNSAWPSGLPKETERLSEGLLPYAESQTTIPD